MKETAKKASKKKVILTDLEIAGRKGGDPAQDPKGGYLHREAEPGGREIFYPRPPSSDESGKP